MNRVGKITKPISPGQQYLSQLDALLAQISPGLPCTPDIICKRVFSGAAAYADGNIFMTLTPAGLALKLPEDARAALLRSGGKPLRYFAKGHIKKDYVVVAGKLAKDVDALRPWIQQSTQFVQTLNLP